MVHHYWCWPLHLPPDQKRFTLYDPKKEGGYWIMALGEGAPKLVPWFKSQNPFKLFLDMTNILCFLDHITFPEFKSNSFWAKYGY